MTVPKTTNSYQLGILPVMLDLYNRLAPSLRGKLNEFIGSLGSYLSNERLEVIVSPVACTESEVRKAHEYLLTSEVDLLVVAHVSYCPSGVLEGLLMETPLPVLLWPAQSMAKLDPAQYDLHAVMENHGVHGTQDLANVLRRRGRAFGVIHGHHTAPTFREELIGWLQAGRAVRAFWTAKPVRIGDAFEHMLDLQIDNADFLRRSGLCVQEIEIDELAEQMNKADEASVRQAVQRYQTNFGVSRDIRCDLLKQTARGEMALRAILDGHDSRAVGLNFLTLCNDPRVGDSLHVPASILMSEGFGYAGEGDWVTAALVYAMQEAFGEASFTEIFSVGYLDHRLVLKHWGEGNPVLARSRPRLLRSTFSDSRDAEFAIVDFEFRPGRAVLANLNVANSGRGQLLVIPGTIEGDFLPNATGPRAVFKPDTPNVCDVLNRYARLGGSHHLVLVYGQDEGSLIRLAELSGWECQTI
jgi:L-arabinose isomerase